MRSVIASLSLSAALLASCSRQSETAAGRPSPDDQRVFLTNFGTLSPQQSPWSVRVDATERIQAWVSYHVGEVTSHAGAPNWHAQSGWFACIGADERVWVYDGQTNLFIVEAAETNGVRGLKAFDINTYRRPVPPAVRSRLSAAAQQLLKHE